MPMKTDELYHPQFFTAHYKMEVLISKFKLLDTSDAYLEKFRVGLLACW